MSDIKDKDYADLINKTASAMNILKEKEELINFLSLKEVELKEQIEKLGNDKVGLESENLKVFQSTEALRNRDTSEVDNIKKTLSIKEEKLNSKEKELTELSIELSEKIAKSSLLNQSNQALEIRNKQLSDEANSKVLEIKQEKNAREAELVAIENAKQELEFKKISLETLRKQAEDSSLNNIAILEEIKRSRNDIQNQFDELTKLKQENADTTNRLSKETASNDYLKGVLNNLILVFRQGLTTFIQVNGSQIRIPEITNEHRRIVIDDLMTQINENPDPIVEEPVVEVVVEEIKVEEPIEVPQIEDIIENPIEDSQEDYSKLSKADIISKLTEKGVIKVNPKLKKEDLLKLL